MGAAARGRVMTPAEAPAELVEAADAVLGELPATRAPAEQREVHMVPPGLGEVRPARPLRRAAAVRATVLEEVAMAPTSRPP
ncbi:hypothetical protein [Promicromonospora soli]